MNRKWCAFTSQIVHIVVLVHIYINEVINMMIFTLSYSDGYQFMIVFERLYAIAMKWLLDHMLLVPFVILFLHSTQLFVYQLRYVA